MSVRFDREVDAHAELGVRNSQAEGIGRVAAVAGLVAWNNLGRNVVFAGRDLVPRRVFGDTAFPGEDEPSQYDLDVHAIVHSGPWVVVLNHLGTARLFRRDELAGPGPVALVRPDVVVELAPDMERLVAVGDRLVGSRPPHDTDGGIMVSAPLGPAVASGRLATEPGLDGWGRVQALAAAADGRSVVVGSDGRVALADMGDGRAGPLRWEVRVPFDTAWVAFDGARVWAAGSDAGATVDDHDWESLRGGGFAAFRVEDGTCVLTHRFEPVVAWGNGGVAVGKAPGTVWALDRVGALHLFDDGDGTRLGATEPRARASLGIAHACSAGDVVVFGYNRGGYRLFAARLR